MFFINIVCFISDFRSVTWITLVLWLLTPSFCCRRFSGVSTYSSRTVGKVSAS